MKTLALPLAVALAASTPAFAADPPVAVDTRGLPQYVAKQVRAEAAKGVVPLRQYLDRTYPVHQLRVDMVLAKEEPAAQFARMKDHERAPGPVAGASVALRGTSTK